MTEMLPAPKPSYDEAERQRMLREIHRIRLYQQCEAIQGQESCCAEQLAELEQGYVDRWGAVPDIDTTPTSGPYCPPADSSASS